MNKKIFLIMNIFFTSNLMSMEHDISQEADALRDRHTLFMHGQFIPTIFGDCEKLLKIVQGNAVLCNDLKRIQTSLIVYSNKNYAPIHPIE